MPATPYKGADSDAYSQTLALLNDNRTEEAAAVCRELCEREPENAAALRLMGVIAFQLGDKEAALGLLRHAVELDPLLPGGQRDLAEAMTALNQADAALAALDIAIAQDPGDAFAYRQRALLLLGAKDLAGAEEAAARALAIAPGLTLAQSTMGLIKARCGDLLRAAEYLMQARNTPKPPPDPTNLLARCLGALGQTPKITELPPSADALERHGEIMLLAAFAWQTNQGDACRRLLEEARFLARNLPADSLRSTGRAELGEMLEVLLDWQATHPEAYSGTVEHQLYHLGDRHCLASAHLVAEFSGRRWLTFCEFIPDFKAWDLAKPEEGLQRATFRAAVERIPKGAALLVSCGAGDCSLNSGIPAYVRRNRQLDPGSLVDALVPAFVEALLEITAPRDLKIILETPRASNAPEALVPHKELVVLKSVMRQFCQRLRDVAREKNLRLLDLNAATSDAQGRSKGHLYFDTDHLRPQAYLETFAAGLR